MKKSRQALKVILCSMLALAILVSVPSGKINKPGNDTVTPFHNGIEYDDV